MRIALNMHSGERYGSGFTILEVLIVIALVTILMAIGIPSFQYVTTANRISAEVNGLIGDMQYARAEAIKEGQTVVVCVFNGNSGTPGCATGNSWQNGWVVCSDPAADGACDAGQPVYRVQNPFTSTDTFVASSNTSTVTFNREGFAVGLPGIITIALHNVTSVPAYTRCLALSAVGILQVQTVGVGNCT
jgi:type IV fimbrial biogenesis protein FimT